MKKANLTLDGNSTGMTLIEKMDFERVEAVFDVLYYAFHPDDHGHEYEDLDDRCRALWVLFLATTGWTEEEFWETWENKPEECPDCGKPLDHDDQEQLSLPETKATSTDKPN